MRTRRGREAELSADGGGIALDTIVCADALDFLRTLPDESIDMILTSPPYDNLRAYKGYSWDFEGIAAQMYRVLKIGGVAVWVVGDATINGCETLTGMRHAIHFVDVNGFKLDDTMIYKKAGTTPQLPVRRYSQDFEYMFVLGKGGIKTRNILTTLGNGQSKMRTRRQRDGHLDIKFNGGGDVPLSNIWELGRGWMVSTPDKEAYEHPAMFPEELARRHILTWSNPGDVVLDFFVGSGTTAKMARNTGRHYLGCDIAPEYVALCHERLRQPFEQHYITPNNDVSDLPLFASRSADD